MYGSQFNWGGYLLNSNGGVILLILIYIIKYVIVKLIKIKYIQVFNDIS